MNVLRPISFILLGVAVVASPALAKKNNPNIELTFLPQQAMDVVVPTISAEMLEVPVRITVLDSRPDTAGPDRIGTRSDDDDQAHHLRAVNDVVPFVAGVLVDVAGQWGLQVEPEAALELEVSLISFQCTEENQAVGATFSAQVRFSARLNKRSAGQIWSGTAAGTANRYGKKFSNENVNEVLSDALLDALANLLASPGVHDGWGGRVAARAMDAEAPAAAEPISPAALLVEVEELMQEDFGASTLRTFVEQQVLSVPFTADDMKAWKQAGVAEEVLQVALALPVR